MAYPATPSGPYMAEPPEWGELLHEVGISSSDLYHQIVGAIQRGSGDPSLSWGDFDFITNSDYDEAEHKTPIELIERGMAPLDAIVWVSGQNKPDSAKITKRQKADDKKVIINDIYSGFFAWYFSLYSQGRSVGQGDPNFLIEVLAMGPAWSDLIKALSTADITKFPTTWVKNVNLVGLSEKSRNRLALGAAGHRYVSCLKYVRAKDFMAGTAEAQAFLLGIRNWTKDKVWWDLHPITKSGAIITVTGSINKLIEDCLANSIRPERLLELSKAKILNHVPLAVPTHSHWAAFDLRKLPALVDSIF